MFEKEIKFIYDFNLNKVNKLGPYFTFEQLISADLHPAIQHYISAEIDYLIFEDRQKLLKNSVFDYSGEKIAQYFAQISDEVKRSKRFAHEYISKLILHAASFTINFLVRPKWTLVKFIYDEGNHKTTAEIKQILNYLYYHKYLKKIIVSYINSKKIISMNSIEFSELIDKVDQLGVESYLPSIISNSLKSMAEFFNIGELQKNKIPLSAVDLFLEEKQLTKHLEKVRLVFGDDKFAKFGINEFMRELDGIMLEREESFSVAPAANVLDQISETEIIKQNIVTDESLETVNQLNDEEIKSGDETKIAAEVKSKDETEEVKIETEKETKIESEVVKEKTYSDQETDTNEMRENELVKENVVDIHDSIAAEKSDDNADKAIEDEFYELTTEDINKETGIDKDKPKEDKSFKIKFKFGKDNSIERIDEELETPKDKHPVEKVETSKEINLFDDFDEEIVEDVEPKKEEVKEKKIEKFDDRESDKDFDDIDSAIEAKFGDKNRSDFYLRDEDEVKDYFEPSSLIKIKEDSIGDENRVEEDLEIENRLDENLSGKINDAESVLDDDEDDHESILKAILNSSSKDENDYVELGKNKDKPLERENSEQKLNLTELLEHKEMTKIIEIIFDYDIEEFSNTLEEIMDCKLMEDAFVIINNSLKQHGISRKSKEAELFRNIISEYFEK